MADFYPGIPPGMWAAGTPTLPRSPSSPTSAATPSSSTSGVGQSYKHSGHERRDSQGIYIMSVSSQ
eukprot:8891995-Alexandrium_andersonii.AAC.1